MSPLTKLCSSTISRFGRIRQGGQVSSTERNPDVEESLLTLISTGPALTAQVQRRPPPIAPLDVFQFSPCLLDKEIVECLGDSGDPSPPSLTDCIAMPRQKMALRTTEAITAM